MKTLYSTFFALLILATQGVVAQNTNFIEVTASDTIKLKPVKIKYLISESKSTMAYDYDYDWNSGSDRNGAEDDKKNPNSGLKEVESILKKNKVKYSQYTGTKTYRIKNKNSYSSSKDPSEGILVIAESTDELNKVFLLLKDVEDIDARISEVEYESPEPYKDKLFKTIFNKAKVEANLIASTTGLTLGNVLQVTETSGTQTGTWWDWYLQLFGSLGVDEILDVTRDINKTYTRQFTFRFAVN